MVSKSGCSFSDTISIVIDPMVNVSLGNDTSLCGIPSIDLTFQSKPGEIIKWSTGIIGPSISVENSGEYWVDVMNSSGCAASDTIIVGIGQVPVFSLGADTSKCLANVIRLSSPIVAASYSWNTGNSADFIDVNSPGSYSLRVTSNGCSFGDTIIISDKPLPDFNLGNDTLICNGEFVNFDLNGVGDNVLWEDGSTNPLRTITEPGTYSVSVELSGCAATDEIRIIDRGVPNINIGGDTALCFGQPFTIMPVVSGGIFKYWENESEIAIRTITEPGIYIATAENLCGISSDTILVKTGGSSTGTYNIPNVFSPNGDGRNDCFNGSKAII